MSRKRIKLIKHVKGFAPQIVEIEIRLSEAQTELAIQSEHIIKTFDHQIGVREVQAEALANNIAAQLAEEKRLNDTIRDDWQRDTWLTHQLKKLDCATPIVLPDGAINDVALGDLVIRKDAVNQMMQTAEAVREDAEHYLPITLKAVQNFAKEVLPRIGTYRERLQKVADKNYISWMLADMVLAVFDHGILSGLPFIAPLKKFSEDQKRLADYTNHLVQMEAQFEQVRTLDDPLAIETQQQVQNLNNQLVAHQSYLPEQSRTFLTTVSKDITDDELEKIQVTSVDADTKIMKRDVPNWLLSGVNDLTTSTQEFITRLSDVQTQYSRHRQMEDTLKQGHQEQTRLNGLTIAIEKVIQAKAQNEQTLRQIQAELTALTTERERFTGEAEADRYQTQLTTYRQKAEQGLSPLHLLLQDAELSGQKKAKFLQDLVQSHPDCVHKIDEEKQTPLHLAVKQGDVAMVTLLLQKGAKANVINAKGVSPLALALTAHQQDMVAGLKHHGADPGLVDANALLNQSIQERNIANVKLLFAEKDWLGIHLNQSNKNALLHLAAKAGDIAFFEQLIDLGADIHSRDDQNHTLLLSIVTGFASLSDEGKKTRLLNWVKSLNFDTKDKIEGNNALHLAILAGQSKLVEQIIAQVKWFDAITLLNEPNGLGDTALHLLCQKGEFKLVQQMVENTLLISRSILLQAKSHQGENLLHAAMNDPVNLDLIEYLIEQDDALIHQENQSGEKPFETEVGQRVFSRIRNAKDLYPKLYQLLVNQKVEQNYQRQLEAASARLKQPSILLETTMDNTSQASSQPVDVLKLYQAGKRRGRVLDEIENENVPLSKKNPDQNTLLHLAVVKNDLEMVNLIKAQAARAEQKAKWIELLDIQNSEGDTPLHLAVKLGQVELVRLFLADRGDFLLSKDGQGNTIWQIAFDLKNAPMLAVMLENLLLVLRSFTKATTNSIDFDQDREATDFWLQVIETKLLGKKALLHVLLLTDKHHQSLGHALLNKAVKHQDKDAQVLITSLLVQHQYDAAIIHALVGSSDFRDDAFKVFWIKLIEATPKDQKGWLINAQDRYGNTLLHVAVQDIEVEELGESNLPKVEIPGSVDWCLRNGAIQETEFELESLKRFYAEVTQVFQYKTQDKIESFIARFLTQFNLSETAIKEALASCQRCLANDELSRADQSAIVGILIEACGFDRTVKNAEGKSVLALAREGWEEDTQAWMFKDYHKKTIYLALIKRVLDVLGNTQALQEEMQIQTQKGQKKRMTFQKEAGDTPLHLLVKTNLLNEKNWIGTLLGNIPSLLDIPNESGRTPLHIAVLKGDLNQVEFLLAKQEKLNKSAIVNLQDHAGQTVLHLLASGAIKGEATDIIAITELLLRQGTRVNIGDRNGETPLHQLAKRRDDVGFELFKRVLARGANVNAVDQNGETVLHHLAQREDDRALEMVKLIQATKRAKTHIQNQTGWTATAIAWVQKNEAFLSMFPLSAKEAINVKIIEFKDAIKGVFNPTEEKEPAENPEKMDTVYPPVLKNSSVRSPSPERKKNQPEPTEEKKGQSVPNLRISGENNND